MESTEAKCVECENTATVSELAMRSYRQMDRELPMSWQVELLGRVARGGHALAVYCPLHRDHAQEKKE